MKKIFILRNNDLGDVLVATPLAQGLKKAFPDVKIAIGVGDWSKPLLKNNPDIDQIIPCNAPWHNKQNCRYPANSPMTFAVGLLYVILSKEARFLSKESYTHGIDFLGSRQGSWLLRRIGIPNRYGVRGYAGGDKWCNDCIDFQEDRKVAESGLAFLQLLDAKVDIEPRPRIFLTEAERNKADNRWGGINSKKKRIIIAPGGGFPQKCWGDERFSQLTKLLLHQKNHLVLVIGAKEDRSRIHGSDQKFVSRFHNLCGTLTLRESAALVSRADFVITNSSLCMHLAGAFKIPALTLLGEWYESAKTHHQQWGYPESLILGKECSEGRRNPASPKDALSAIKNHTPALFQSTE